MGEPAVALRHGALAVLVALVPAAASALGICRQEAARNDGYMQLLCEGENSLGDQQPRAAIEHFSAAAALPRSNASNELAWAGLASGPAVWAIYLGIIAMVVVALFAALGRVGRRGAAGARPASQPVGAPSS